MTNKQPLAGKTLQQLDELTATLGLPRYAAKQIANWIYVKKVTQIEEMTNLSLAHRNLLSEQYEVGYFPATHFQKSQDGTIKYLFKAPNGAIETVYIPDKERATLCVSSQVGCKMNCSFCFTGKQGFTAQLTATDIINQIISIPESNELTNVVFMGMGEPLDNIEAVLTACEILTAPWGFAWSPKRITVSTIGVLPQLKRFLDESHCHIAISLHAPTSEQRLEIMPIEKAYPIAEIIEILKQYDFTGQRRLSFEYTLFNQFNDTPAHADALVSLLKGLDCRVNLIRYHAIPGVSLHSSNERAVNAFNDYLNTHRTRSTIRASRGEDIYAACGMLSGEKKEK